MLTHIFKRSRLYILEEQLIANDLISRTQLPVSEVNLERRYAIESETPLGIDTKAIRHILGDGYSIIGESSTLDGDVIEVDLRLETYQVS